MTSSRSRDALFGGVVVVLTESQFKEIVPTMKNAVQWVPVLRETVKGFDIDNTDRLPKTTNIQLSITPTRPVGFSAEASPTGCQGLIYTSCLLLQLI